MITAEQTQGNGRITGLGSLRRIGRKLMICLVVALFLFGGQIACWSDETNRLAKGWKAIDGAAILLDVVLLGLLFTLGAMLVNRSKRRWLKSLARFAFLLLVAMGVIGTISACFDCGDGSLTQGGRKSCGWPITLAWVVAVPLLFVARDRLMRPATSFCLIMFPLVPILFVQMCSWDTFGARPIRQDPATAFQTSASTGLNRVRGAEPQNTRGVILPDENEASPVLIFLFDEWSFVRSADGREFHSFLPNIRGLSEQAIVFTKARSPGPCTDLSVPALVYQDEGRLRPIDGRIFWETDDACVPADSAPTFFGPASIYGYKTAFVGSFLGSFSTIMRDRVDYYGGCGALTPPRAGLAGWTDHTRDLLVQMAGAAARNGRYGNDPLSLGLEYRIRSAKVSRIGYDRTRRFRQQVFDVLDHCPNNTLAFFHWPFPHAPFVFNGDGSYAGPVPAGDKGYTVKGYHRQLCYLDRLVGEIVDRLRKADRFDRAMIILTSDHTWRHDPDPDMQQAGMKDRRIPLIVKMPGQTESVWLDEPFETMRMQPLLEMVMRGDTDRQGALALIDRMSHAQGQQPQDPPKVRVAERAPANDRTPR
ncbi:MAG: sulfatase-like hydrolase/transferase [Planctomycetes bacterium]|nr:sulfatase-like hydrolase/transferase [Planctomycetota bacterium]